MRGENILLEYNKITTVEGSFYMIGLPQFTETFMHFNIKNLQTNMQDIRMINLPGNKKISAPENFNKLGTISYSGKFTGYIDDFVAFGKFKSKLGQLSSDIMIKPYSDNGMKYQGKLIAKSLYAGKLLGDQTLMGAVSMSLNVDGFSSPDSLSANIIGKIESIELNDYQYNNISLSGNLVNKTFDGSFNISDPNIQMDFLGKVDLGSKIPSFNFVADVQRLRPYYLHLNNTDPSYFASFLLKTNFTGKNPDEFNGEIELVNSYFEKSNRNLQIYDFKLSANNSRDSGSIKIRKRTDGVRHRSQVGGIQRHCGRAPRLADSGARGPLRGRVSQGQGEPPRSSRRSL
jgi:hypothetical protein